MGRVYKAGGFEKPLGFEALSVILFFRFLLEEW